MVAPALLLPAWRRLGMLRLKALLAAAVIGTLAVPSLHFDALRAPPHAAPIGESRPHTTPPDGRVHPTADEETATAHAALRWHYVAASLWLALGGFAVATSMARRSRHDNQPPMAANAAITKKAPPASAS
jgi:hypothetical protein